MASTKIKDMKVELQEAAKERLQVFFQILGNEDVSKCSFMGSDGMGPEAHRGIYRAVFKLNGHGSAEFYEYPYQWDGQRWMQVGRPPIIEGVAYFTTPLEVLKDWMALEVSFPVKEGVSEWKVIQSERGWVALSKDLRRYFGAGNGAGCLVGSHASARVFSTLEACLLSLGNWHSLG